MGLNWVPKKPPAVTLSTGPLGDQIITLGDIDPPASPFEEKLEALYKDGLAHNGEILKKLEAVLQTIDKYNEDSTLPPQELVELAAALGQSATKELPWQAQLQILYETKLGKELEKLHAND